MIVFKQPQDPSSAQGDQSKSDLKPGPSSAPSPRRPKYQQVPSHEPMDTTTTEVGPELPPRLRTQYSDISSDPEIEPTRTEKVKYKSTRYVSSSSDASPHRSKSKSGKSSPKQGNITSDKEQEKSRQLASTIVYRDVRELDKERRRSHEVSRELPPDSIYSRKVDLSDLPSQYTEDIETFRQVLDIPDPKHSMPVSNLAMGVNEEQEQQETRPKGPSTFLPANPALKEELTKWEQDFQNLNLIEGKFPKAPQATGR